ncbi:MAG TPA: hypothetical protein VK449_01860 [Anaerolineales bacterium]|nr:hypothetical protein [Anaerolineales bacterium]
MTWVRDGIFAAGGEGLPEAWLSFAAQTGISAILHLRPGAPAAFQGPIPRSFLWLDVAAEDQATLPDRLLAGAFVEACRAEGQRVLLHASLGRQRTRWALVAYRIWCGAAPEVARREASRTPWLAPYATDDAAWARMADAVRNLRRGSTSEISLSPP